MHELRLGYVFDDQRRDRVQQLSSGELPAECGAERVHSVRDRQVPVDCGAADLHFVLAGNVQYRLRAGRCKRVRGLSNGKVQRARSQERMPVMHSRQVQLGGGANVLPRVPHGKGADGIGQRGVCRLPKRHVHGGDGASNLPALPRWSLREQHGHG